MWYYTEGLKSLYSRRPIFRVQSGKKLHRAENFYTDAVCGVCDKYRVCPSLSQFNRKLAKLRRHASRIHFALIHFGKIHFKEIHFGMGCGPVDWWGGSSQNQNSKINGLSFLNFFDLSDRYWDFCKKQFLGTSWMGWGPVDWMRKVLPEAKFKNKLILFFDFFLFEQPILRYL